MKELVLSILVIIGTLFASMRVYAALYDFAVSLEVNSDTAAPQEGHIISFDAGKYVLSSRPYDSNIVGVVVNDPTLFLQNTGVPGAVLVANGGDVKVKVSSANGGIKIGDFITTSDFPGVGQKADRGGYVLGVALDDYESDDPNQVGTIGVLIDIKSHFDPDPLTKNLLSTFSSAFSSPFLTPLASLRYVVALLVTASTFIFAFVYFGRISNRGVEALGRNPLAKASIKRVIVFNFLMTFIIIITGLGISYLILIL